MAKKKEQLEEAVEDTQVEPTEEVVEEVVEETTEEPKEESVEESTEEEVEEETIEDVEEIDTEQLRLDIKETKEELAVIKEVRDELVSLYANYKEVEQLKDNAVSEKEALVSQVEKLSAELHTYKIAEEKLNAEKKLQYLEQLSAKFRALGQEKTVEQLSAKDVETLAEFERIVDAALSKVEETVEMPSMTKTSHTERLSEAKSEEEKPSNEVAIEPKEQLSDTQKNKLFFTGLANQLSGEQIGSNGKRTKLF